MAVPNSILSITASNYEYLENPDPETQKKMDWAIYMRRKFSPPEMLTANGTLNVDYFKPKHIVTVKEKKWTDKERSLLIKGIEKHGIGNWKSIREEFLSEWEAQDLRVKTQVLMGRQSLKQYSGWKGNEQDVKREYQRNYEIGTELGCWKSGMLVADDQGKVLQRLQETAQADDDQ